MDSYILNKYIHERSFQPNSVIEVTDDSDIYFFIVSSRTVITNTTLPSAPEGYDWIITSYTAAILLAK
jgi:hypothetical protein